MAAKILTQDCLKELLHYDPATGIFTNKITRNPRAKQGDIAGYLNTIGYVVIQIERQKIHAHRLAWLYMHGHWPTHEIDHINRKRNDNRISNLRDVTASENRHNSTDSGRNTTGVRNVVWNKRRQKWQAQIMVNNRYKYLGLFTDLELAKQAAKNAVKVLHPTRVA